MTPALNQSLLSLFGIMGLGICIGGVLFFMWLFALVDVIRSEFENQSNKTIWILILIFVAPLGAVLYPFISGDQKRKENKTTGRELDRREEEERIPVLGREDNLPKREEALKNNEWF